MRYVLAETYAQAAYFATKRMFAPESWRFVSSAHVLQGTHAPLVWRVGTWRRRKDVPEIVHMLALRRASCLDVKEAL